jgi:sporulation protein YlmC with PRC-barrel domain
MGPGAGSTAGNPDAHGAAAGNAAAAPGMGGNAGNDAAKSETPSAAPGNEATAPGSPSAGSEAANGAAGTAAAARLKPGQMLFSKMSGAAVYDEQNKSIGDINNLVLDPSGQVAAVVIRSGGFLGLGGKTVAVPVSALRMTRTNGGKLRFTVSMTQAQVKTAPTYSLNPPKNTASGSSTAPAGAGNGAGNGNGR